MALAQSGYYEVYGRDLFAVGKPLDAPLVEWSLRVQEVREFWATNPAEQRLALQTELLAVSDPSHPSSQAAPVWLQSIGARERWSLLDQMRLRPELTVERILEAFRDQKLTLILRIDALRRAPQGTQSEAAIADVLRESALWREARGTEEASADAAEFARGELGAHETTFEIWSRLMELSAESSEGPFLRLIEVRPSAYLQ